MSHFDSLQDSDLSEARARVEALMAQPDAAASLDKATATRDGSEVRKRHMASTTPDQEAKRLRAKFDERRAGQSVPFLTKSATSPPLETADLPAPHITCSRCGKMKHEHEMAKKGKGVLRSFCKSCDADKSKAQYDATRKAVPLTKAASSAPLESWPDRVDRHHREMQGRAWFKGFPVPHDANDEQPTGQADGWYMTVSNSNRYVTREVAFHLARLAGDDSVVTITRNSLAEAVGQVEKVFPRAATDMGLRDLEKRGWIKRDGRTIYLTVGEETVPEVELDWVYTPTELRVPVIKDNTKIEAIRSMFAEIENTWMTEDELETHIAACNGCGVCL